MVKFNSNLKRPKVVIKQTTPLLSKEAPSANISTSNLSHQKRLQQISHSHSRSLPTNSGIVKQDEIGLSSGQALKKLIDEIDRILKQHEPFKNKDNLNYILRYASLLLLAGLNIFKQENLYLGLFCFLVFLVEFVFIERIEKKRAVSTVRSSIKEIRHKMRILDKAFLARKINLDELYAIVLNRIYNRSIVIFLLFVEFKSSSFFCYKLHASH